MIRTLSLTCSRCGKAFSAQDHLYYQDDFSVEKWQIAHAEFHEHNYVLTVTITLQDGTVYDNMDCTPMEDTESVITGEDIPPEAQHALYEYYVAFARQREAQQLKDCFFSKGEDGKMVADLTTVGGEQYDKLAFSVEEGYLKTEQDVPDYILEGFPPRPSLRPACLSASPCRKASGIPTTVTEAAIQAAASGAGTKIPSGDFN